MTDKLTDAQIEEILRGTEGVQGGPWTTMTQEHHGDRSSFEEIEIWSEDNDVLIGTEVRRAHNDGGVKTMRHIARLDPATVVAAFTELAQLRASDKVMREALEWYAEQTEGCRKIGRVGDPFRHALDRDGGKLARAALRPNTDGETNG